MPYNKNVNDDEVNVEGLVGEFMGRMPFDEAAACEDIIAYFAEEVRRGVANRAARIARDDEVMEREDREDGG